VDLCVLFSPASIVSSDVFDAEISALTMNLERSRAAGKT